MFRLLHMKARQMSRDYDAMKPASESGEDSEASGDEPFPVDEVSRIRWAELMSSSQRGETFRELARDYADRIWLMHKKARLSEAQKSLEAAQEARERVDLRTARQRPEVVLGFKQEEEHAKKLIEELQAEICEDGPIQPSWCDEWVEELNRMSPAAFMEYVTVLSVEKGQEHLYKFMSSLSLELTWSRAEARLYEIPAVRQRLQLEHGCHFCDWKPVLGGSVFSVLFHQPSNAQMHRDDVESCFNTVSSKKFTDFHMGQTLWSLFKQKIATGDRACAKASYSITPLVQLFQCRNQYQALLLKVVVDMGNESQCMNTVVGRAILAETHRRTHWGNLLDTFLDLMYIAILIRMSFNLENHTYPETPLIELFAALSVWITGSLCLKLGGGMYLFRGTRAGLAVGLLKHLDLYTVALSAIEVFSVYVGCRFIAYGTSDGFQTNQAWELFQKHPGFLSALVLTRWMQVLFSVCQLEGVGSNVVPVFHAVTRPASVNFILVLMLGVMASFHAYFVFPISENVGSINNVLNGFLKIFRLELLGDFDLAELEGLGERLSGNFTHGYFKGKIGEDAHTNIHRWLRFEFMVLSVVVTVVAMNVYIGLLGELYSKAVERKNGLYNHWLASTAYRFLCRQIGVRVLLCDCEWFSFRPQDKGPGLMWFAYEEDHLIDTVT
ncbi:Uncharacterized protein SCF082_LOCUS48123 [Durusdinium trenchii]|uniref:Ion transport domain-containing protein n=1 Tax=Durusdinium trenchii TaxID=1381693 RepID=A0ABP0RS96_9DINO